MKRHNFKFVCVDWVDSSSRRNGWQDLDIKETILMCRSVGYMIASTKDLVTITGHLSYGYDDGRASASHCPMTIPRRAITRITSLKEPVK